MLQKAYNFHAYYKQFQMLWGKKLNRNEKVVYTDLFFWMVNNIKGMTLDSIEKDFYIDFGFDVNYKDFGMGKNSVSNAVYSLEEKGLFTVRRGQKNTGVSRFYFPLVIPTPEELDIQAYYINYYKGKDTTAIEEIKRNQDFQNKVNNSISIEREKYDDIYIAEEMSHTEKRIRIQKLFIALLDEKDIPLDTRIELYAGETASSFFRKIGVYHTNTIKEVLDELREEELEVENDIKKFISNLYNIVINEAEKKISEGKEQSITISDDILNVIKEKQKKEKKEHQKPRWRMIWGNASQRGIEQELKALKGILNNKERFKLSEKSQKEVGNAISNIQSQI